MKGDCLRSKKGKRMGLFNSRQPKASPTHVEPASQIPVAQIDLSKRYDVYCTDVGCDRLYENVSFVGIRTINRVKDSYSFVDGFLEIESADGSRCLIPRYGIQLICEHGTQPPFKVLRRRRDRRAW